VFFICTVEASDEMSHYIFTLDSFL
jgi:hypothetical protein